MALTTLAGASRIERVRIEVQPLTPEAYLPYGWVLGARPAASRPDYRESESVRFWEEHLPDVGGGELQLVWVNYRGEAPPIGYLEQHRLTEQAIVPVTGSPIVHVVAPPPSDPMDPDARPDLSRLAAFRLDGRQGVCLRRGTWHNHRSLADDAVYLMLTRASTTVDLRRGAGALETAFFDLGGPLDLDFSRLAG